MSAIASALHRGYVRDAERLRSGVLRHPDTEVNKVFAMLMLSIAVKLVCGVKPGA